MFLIDFILHIDRHLQQLASEYGLWVYGIVFLIVFCETDLVRGAILGAIINNDDLKTILR